MNLEVEVALITGASTVAGVLAGSIVVWILGNRSQLKADKRTAFVELLAALDACSLASIQIRGTPKDVPDFKLRTQEAVASIGRVDSARSLVALMLPSRARPAIDAAVAAATNAVAAATADVTGEQIGRIEGAPTITAAYDDVLALAKRELGYKE